MTAPELSRKLLAERVWPAGFSQLVEADAAECAAVALRLQVPAVAAVSCRWELQPGPAGSVLAQGSLVAVLTQDCVVSTEPFESSVTEEFTVRFVVEGRESAAADDPEAPDELGYDGREIDLGEATVEQLALALDPYPRAPGASLPAADEATASGPFAALGKLRGKG